MSLSTRSRIAKVLRIINPNYISFLAGVIVSAGIGVYMELLGPNALRWLNGVVGGSLLLFSSLFLTSLSLSLQEIHDLVAKSPLPPQEQETFHQKLIIKSLRRFVSLSISSIALFVLGMIVLALGKW